MNKRTYVAAITMVGLVALLVGIGCNNDISKTSSPVELLMHVTSQPIQVFDLAALTTTACQQSVSTDQIENRIKNPATSNTAFLDVKLTRYRVEWTRTDGGGLGPAPVHRSMTLLIPAGGTSNTFVFHIADVAALDQSPFVSLLPQKDRKSTRLNSSHIPLSR